jgi:ribosomal protein S24E
MKVKKDFKNELLNRREVEVIVTADKTPSFADMAKKLAEHFKAHEDNIMMEKVGGKFGRSTFLVKACIYDNKELKEAAFKRLIKQKKIAVAPAA